MGRTDWEEVGNYIKSLPNIPILSKQEEIDLGRLARNGDTKARNKLGLSNLRLVISVAKNIDSGDILDNIQVGNMELFENILDKWDPELGFKFSTYAARGIKTAIMNALSNQSYASRYFTEKTNKLRYIENEFKQEYGKKPTIEDIRNRTGWGEDQTKSIMDASRTVWHSLENIILENSSLEPGEEETKTIEKRSTYEILRKSMSVLDDREKDIINRHYFEDESFKDISKSYNSTKQNMSLIAIKALPKMRRYLERQDISTEDIF